MSDAAAIPFNSWVVQPGNHRLLLRIKDKLCSFLEKDVEIRSWADVYGLFEESFQKNEKSKKWFQPLFVVQPPTSKSGASPHQIRLYRGAFVDPSVLQNPDPSRSKQITYRGQTMTVEAKPQEQLAAAPKKPRMYRGVRID